MEWPPWNSQDALSVAPLWGFNAVRQMHEVAEAHSERCQIPCDVLADHDPGQARIGARARGSHREVGDSQPVDAMYRTIVADDAGAGIVADATRTRDVRERDRIASDPFVEVRTDQRGGRNGVQRGYAVGDSVRVDSCLGAAQR